MEEQKEKKQGHKGKGQKYKSLLVWDILQKRTDENHASAGFEDFCNALTFDETEMLGSSELIGRARSYVKDKFRRSAAKIGANAVLGLEFESSIGADIVRVAMFGTAVVIEKKDA